MENDRELWLSQLSENNPSNSLPHPFAVCDNNYWKVILSSLPTSLAFRVISGLFVFEKNLISGLSHLVNPFVRC